MEKLTAKQQKIYDYIQTFFRGTWLSPLLSVRSARLWGLKSPSTVISI